MAKNAQRLIIVKGNAVTLREEGSDTDNESALIEATGNPVEEPVATSDSAVAGQGNSGARTAPPSARASREKAPKKKESATDDIFTVFLASETAAREAQERRHE